MKTNTVTCFTKCCEESWGFTSFNELTRKRFSAPFATLKLGCRKGETPSTALQSHSCSPGLASRPAAWKSLIVKGHGNSLHLPFLSSKAKSSPGVFDSCALITMAAFSSPVGDPTNSQSPQSILKPVKRPCQPDFRAHFVALHRPI